MVRAVPSQRNKIVKLKTQENLLNKEFQAAVSENIFFLYLPPEIFQFDIPECFRLFLSNNHFVIQLLRRDLPR